jgi:hypothetical protein
LDTGRLPKPSSGLTPKIVQETSAKTMQQQVG